MKKALIEKPFMSKFGEVNVGDEVVYVTTSYGHSVRFSKGIYKGYIETDGEKKVKVCYEFVTNAQFFPNGKEFNWNTDYNSNTWSDIKNTLIRKDVTKNAMITLQLNRIAPLKSQ